MLSIMVSLTQRLSQHWPFVACCCLHTVACLLTFHRFTCSGRSPLTCAKGPEGRHREAWQAQRFACGGVQSLHRLLMLHLLLLARLLLWLATVGRTIAIAGVDVTWLLFCWCSAWLLATSTVGADAFAHTACLSPRNHCFAFGLRDACSRLSWKAAVEMMMRPPAL